MADHNRRLVRGELAKYHALGNDYLVLDAEVSPYPTPSAVAAWCSRHTGLGSDGLLLRLPPRKGGTAELRIFNPDGSQAEKSGNGLRIFARFLLDAGYADGPVVHIELADGVAEARISVASPRLHGSVEPMDIDEVAVMMGEPKLTYAAVGAPGGEKSSVLVSLAANTKCHDVSLVGIGNPHCVVFDAALEQPLLQALGPAIEHHPLFANRTNVQLARVESRSKLSLLIWERGAGETSASGSSSCAAVAAAQARGLVDDVVLVEMPGGTVRVERQDDGKLWLYGPATPVARAHLWHTPMGKPRLL